MNKKYSLALLSILIFAVLAFIYCFPVFDGKTLSMHDTNMAAGGAKELVDFKKQTGEWAWWTNSMFGGMPAFMIAGGYPYSIISSIGSFITNLLPIPVNIIFLLMLGFYILINSTKSNFWVAIAGSIAYAFGTYNLLYLEAGHVSKILALAYAPPIIAGINYLFRGKYVLGTFIVALFGGLELYANHPQITYYFIFVFGAYLIFKFLELLKSKNSKNAIKIMVGLAIAALISAFSHTTRLWNNYVYSKETTRGKSELAKTTVGKNGLDQEYAFSWSYGIDETFNLLVPNLMGGGSVGKLDENSATYKTMTAGGVDPSNTKQFIGQLPLYFGDQSFTTGPAYVGVCVLFLYLLGFFLIKSRWKWVNLGLTIMFIVFAWGYHFNTFNTFIFNYLPGYNKFRAVTMTLTVVHFLFVWGASNTLNAIFNGNFELEKIKKPLFVSIAIIAIISLGAYFMVSFQGPKDQEFKKSIGQNLEADFANRIFSSIVEDRKSMAFSDVIRGIIFTLLISVLIWLNSSKKIGSMILGIGISVLIFTDMVSVGKRYFNNDDFVPKFQAKAFFDPSTANQTILQDTDPNFRVLNTTTSFWSDATDSYFHKSIGGYHGAKLKIIQELYDNQMIKNNNINMPIFNMLNTKYFIVNDPKNGPTAQLNPSTFGNAWFVDSLRIVSNADESLADLSKYNLKKNAILEKKFYNGANAFKVDSSDKIKLISYKPNELIYESNSKNNVFAVFSEVFYRGNLDWISTIDGKPADHIKTNYVLRGMAIPAGKHEIKFEFKPVSVEKGKFGDMIASGALLLLGIFTVFNAVKKKD